MRQNRTRRRDLCKLRPISRLSSNTIRKIEGVCKVGTGGMEGVAVGEAVSTGEGEEDGVSVGENVGEAVGEGVSELVGVMVGDAV